MIAGNLSMKNRESGDEHIVLTSIFTATADTETEERETGVERER